MAQVGIVTISWKKYREYAIEPGDNLTTVCLRFGHKDWRAVYDLDANAAFRTRFPDPDDIDYVNPVNLFIPLVKVKLGTSVKGSPSSDFYVVKLEMENGSKAPANTQLVHIYNLNEATKTATVKNISVNANGEVIISNPPAGANYLASGGYLLTDTSMVYPPVLVSGMDKLNKLTDPTAHGQLLRNDTTTFILRKVYYITCTMCGRDYMTVKPGSADPDNSCPDDGFNLSDIERDIEASSTSFTSPATGQNPRTAGNKCRGTSTFSSIHGSLSRYWDESRFVNSNGGSYSLYDSIGHLLVDIVGRSTWGAAPILTSTSFEWGFQQTAKGASAAYSAVSIPNNEIIELKSVFQWMTVHHTTDSALNSTATVVDLQTKQQGTNADISYHYVIDGDGTIYEGRPLGIKGTHVVKFNGGNIGIVLAGDFESRAANFWSPDTPTAAALASLDNLLQVLSARFDVSSAWSHQQRANQAGFGLNHTECCGDTLISTVNGRIRGLYPGPPP